MRYHYVSDEHDYVPIIGPYIEDTFSTVLQATKQNTIRLSAGTILHAKRSKNYSVIEGKRKFWYGLDKHIFEEFMTAPTVYLLLRCYGSTNLARNV